MVESTVFDICIVGGGIAGASLAYRLAHKRHVIVIEAEEQPGFHSTGRSAAMYMETYGTPQIRALTKAGFSFYQQPPSGFTDAPIITDRGCLYVARNNQQHVLQKNHAIALENKGEIELLNANETQDLAPCLNPQDLYGALFEPNAKDLDVHALHQGYLKGITHTDSVLRCKAQLTQSHFNNGIWTIQLQDGRIIKAKNIVNAAGAWADQVATLCHVPTIGLTPYRRSAFTFDAPAETAFSHWPCIADIEESYYFKPDAGQLLGSPANTDPSYPHDVMPEELDIATGIYHIEQATTLRIPRPKHTWAGLRSFVPDGDLVVGWDNHQDNFFWLAAQGGYGIQSSAGVSELAYSLIINNQCSERLLAYGVQAEFLSPSRLR